MFWRMQVLAARAANPAGPAYIYARKSIRPTRELPPGTLKPIGLRNWLGCVLVEMFNVDESKTLVQLEEESDYGVGYSGSGGDALAALETRQTRAHKRPPPPTSPLRYHICSQHLSKFMLETNRWDSSEAALHDAFVNFCLRKMEQYPLSDVLVYDSDFRMKRHVLQDRGWLVPDEDLLRKRLTDPLHARSQASSLATSATSSSGATGGFSSREFMDRPCFGKLSFKGGQVCARWNWNVGCLSCQPSEDVSGCESNRYHVCSFCNGPHRLTSCDAFQAAHPEDLKRGYYGK